MPSLYEISIPPMISALRGLKHLLELGEQFCQEQKTDPTALLQSRLHPDMLGLIFQVQMCCNTAKLLAKRLGGYESRVFPDDETTFAQLYTRIDDTLAILCALKPDCMDGDEKREIHVSTPLTSFTLGALDHITLYALPNFHFHKTTAYAILRSQGVKLSKVDYMHGIKTGPKKM